MQKQTSFKGVVILLLTALIWSISFVSQSAGIKFVDAFTFSSIRTLMGSFVLLPFIFIRDALDSKKMTAEQIAERKKRNLKTLKLGVILGIFLCAAINFQQFSFYYSNAGKIAFITALYMFFVPILGIFFKKKIPGLTWFCVVVAGIGMYFLCFADNHTGKVNLGDILSFICAIFFSLQIIFVEKFVQECDGVKLSFVQFFTTGIISLILMFIFEKPQWEGIKNAAIPLLYSGIMSCGVAFTLQVIGQKYCEATIASLLMCTESVFAVLAAAIIINDRLTPNEIIGCCVMFCAILISQIADIIRKRRLT